MFDKILIANRGEIACRVIKTARRLNIATVAVYSEADKDALHVAMADEAIAIGGSASTESYLAIDRLLEAIEASGAQAVHPGYGFLSENAAFAEALIERGIAFIGPAPRAITAMGDKITSKRLAGDAGVNTIPGHLAVIADGDEAVQVAGGIGYPVMLKASAGGGGKGMRIAWNDDECREGFERATSEARSSFGDDRIFVEKFIAEPRHIEIQVLADDHGNAVFLNERECSVQRRHQKVIEECPSPFIDGTTRHAMGEQALVLARAVDYRSAGTVEFIVDAERHFYFLEMNTRLQVEHPVTEMVTGIDLVEEMIRIAAGEQLRITQSDVRLEGWAMEARIYAEDPTRGFLPSTGRLVRYSPPRESGTIRVDTGVYEGGEVSVYYDPMIAKLIAFGPDRRSAVHHLLDALDEFLIAGVRHNIDFLSAVATLPRFLEGRLTTNLIAEEFPDGFVPHRLTDPELALLITIAVAAHTRSARRDAAISGQLAGRTRVLEDRDESEWRVMCGDAAEAVTHRWGGERQVITHGPTARVVTSDWSPGEPLFRGTVDDRPICVRIEPRGVGYRVAYRGAQADLVVLAPRAAELLTLMPVKEPPDTSKYLLAPMPGLLVSVSVEAGEKVKAGRELAVVEAMKMENVLRSDRDCTVSAVLVSPGDSLSVDQPILEFE